jgi:hypothetical protein
MTTTTCLLMGSLSAASCEPPPHRRERRGCDRVAPPARDRAPTHGYAGTREAAMAAFAKSWRREYLTDFQGTVEPARDFGLERRGIAAVYAPRVDNRGGALIVARGSLRRRGPFMTSGPDPLAPRGRGGVATRGAGAAGGEAADHWFPGFERAFGRKRMGRRFGAATARRRDLAHKPATCAWVGAQP